jgi:HK97 family phage major capsid protein
MEIKELLDKADSLKKQGHDIVEKAYNDTKAMSAEDKEKHAKETGWKDQELAVRLELEQTKQMLKAAQNYRDDEKDEILREFSKNGAQNGGSVRRKDEFPHLGYLLQAMAIASGHPMIASAFGHAEREEAVSKLRAYHAAASGMSVGTPSDGGYLVRKDWTTQFLQKGLDRSALLPRTTQIKVGAGFDGLEYPYIDETSRVTGSRWGGVQVFWVAEAETVTAKKPKIGKGSIELTELMGLAYATNRLLKDATALRSILTNSFESEIGFKIDDALFRGNGAGMPLGFLAGPSLISVTRASDHVDLLLDMYSRMPGRLKPGSIWIRHSDWIKYLPKIKIGDTPVWLPPGGMINAPAETILGKEVLEMEQASAVGTAGDLNYVNMGEYVTITKEGEDMAFDESMHVRFEYNEMAFRWVYRINGQPIARSAITPYTGSSTLSPFITVAA